ncbi:TetR/AcrR family transcriptional regulator [Microbacterium suwonense]|uniref:TetR family transcriptional regulator n=1 Tax=Microbacterium suwonense TaxID=683047 RepID=A0ABM8FVA1_9MICO|nr:TetR/AcrR family transcriptional regulator [Microbacterium suwonense]BDZ39444.1 TetR family transcriptional regulator [Microbacterium suwonense]
MTQTTKTTRPGSATKRAAILSAARQLFIRNGVDRTSMDSVARHANVSKRTVYDYYGDKRGLLLGVIEESGEALLASLRAGIDAHLSDDTKISDISDLEAALTAFAMQAGASLVESSDYSATVKLISENAAALPELEDHPLDRAHREVLAERFAHFAERGMLDIDDPQLAADQFNALTTLLAYTDRQGESLSAARVATIMRSGVRTFVRAYARP